MSSTIYTIPYYQIQTPITLNTSFTLNWVPIFFLGYFIQIEWTGTPTGVFYLEASGDKYKTGTMDVSQISADAPFFTKKLVESPTHASLVASSQYSVTTAGLNAWNVQGARYNWVRLGYTDNSAGASAAQLTFVNVSQKGPF